MTSRLISTLFACFVASPAFAGGTGPQPAEPAAQSFTLGEFRITSLRDALNIVPNDGSIFGANVGPKAVTEVLSRAGGPGETINLSVDALLAQKGSEAILLDTGLGPAIPGALPGSLSLAGVSPDQVTRVLITHVHGDHVGGLVTKEGNPAFKNAVVMISGPDWKWLQQQPEMAKLCNAIASQVKTFAPGDGVSTGITSVQIPGHTPGHVGYLIESKGQSLLDVGDTVHSSVVSLAEPDWDMGYDNDRVVGRTSRRDVLTKLAADHQLVFAPHFPYPGLGWIGSKGDQFEWLPKK
ncbi:MBL fold metallo-hydrolase [Rhizobium sp. BG4]|uniref:MBL fold metallo-hydrolase n=1 Tax=Rhizobium sp. BG4 TaxID=2613770 RepID=UPI00193DEC6E|nr:MBL fold metallo-hydrolase [Rhizobium sp. BG4]QRM45839.1 MBL fold metallo-hydrolase [Rhizobium sp. BG4]